jgi:hypothetical protein
MGTAGIRECPQEMKDESTLAAPAGHCKAGCGKRLRRSCARPIRSLVSA